MTALLTKPEDCGDESLRSYPAKTVDAMLKRIQDLASDHESIKLMVTWGLPPKDIASAIVRLEKHYLQWQVYERRQQIKQDERDARAAFRESRRKP